MSARLAVAALLAVAAAASRGGAQGRPRAVSEAEAQRLLKAPVRIEAKAAAVLRRSAQGYGRLSSLLTESEGDGVKTVTRLKRPRYYHSLRHQSDGELIRLSISDGRAYYDYVEAARRYVQRDASTLSKLALPVNARPFFVDVSRGAMMRSPTKDLTVREYAFHYAGEEKAGAGLGDRLRVSTLIRSRSGWRTFDSLRTYDRKSGLLTRVVSGEQKLRIKNRPNARLPTEGFVWRTIPGATHSFE